LIKTIVFIIYYNQGLGITYYIKILKIFVICDGIIKITKNVWGNKLKKTIDNFIKICKYIYLVSNDILVGILISY